MKQPFPSSAIAWRGPSQFTGDIIQVVVQGMVQKSANDKTGKMVQVSITRPDAMPVTTFGAPAERAVCGNCPFRGKLAVEDGKRRWPVKRVCYVRWLAFLLGQHQHKYSLFPASIVGVWLKGMKVRVGAYGDPAAVPMHVWEALLANAAGWTGYTHDWRLCDPAYRTVCMASTETVDGYLQAMDLGWRSFRARTASMPLMPSEFRCPAESRGTKCEDCMLCCGTASAAKNVAIIGHGAGAGRLADIAHPALPLPAY